MTYKPLSSTERSTVEESIATLERLGDAVDSWWATSTQCRQTGFTLHVKFDKKTDVLTSGDLARVMTQSPGMLASAYRRLLEADKQITEVDR